MIFETRRVDVPIVLVGQLCDHTNTEMNATEAMKEEAGLWDERKLQAKVTGALYLNATFWRRTASLPLQCHAKAKTTEKD